jgi:hypothetical protein
MATIKPYDDPRRESDPNSLELLVYPKPTDRSTTLVDLMWITHTETGAKFTPVIEKQPMDADDARQEAMKFAESNEIPTIYERAT